MLTRETGKESEIARVVKLRLILLYGVRVLPTHFVEFHRSSSDFLASPAFTTFVTLLIVVGIRT